MKTGCRRLMMMFVLCGVFFLVGYMYFNSKGISYVRNGEAYKVEAESNKGEESELMLVNSDKNYRPEGLTIPNITFTRRVKEEEKFCLVIRATDPISHRGLPLTKEWKLKEQRL